ncbi:MAG: nucleotidyltransferase domain-containing protein [Cyanobium sp.]
MADCIHRAIPGSEVRLSGSRARGHVGPDSDIDLLITAPDDWVQRHPAPMCWRISGISWPRLMSLWSFCGTPAEACLQTTA